VIENTSAKKLYTDVFEGRSNRRDVLKRAALLGFSAPVAAALANAAHFANVSASTEGTLSVTYYDWILNLHPIMAEVNSDFSATFPLDAQVAPTAGFGIERFVQEARENMSTWDMYIGATPFLEMIQLAESGSIEPWDPYLPEGFLDDLPESIRAEGNFNGSFYVWPFLLDVTLQAWNGELVEKAGLDPSVAPATWDEFIANARTVQESGAAPFGLTFDFHAWRSLIPITHSISTDVYDENGLFMWTSDAAVQALEIMKQFMELANPDVLNEGTTDGGVNQTPDEQAFASMRAAYYIKYQNAPMRFAGTWPDPTRLQMSALPAPAGGAGGTVFWDTGAVLFAHGTNKQAAADYMRTISTDERIWQESVAGNPEAGVTAPGQLPVLKSVWDAYTASPPEWLAANPWATSIWQSLPNASAIAPSKLSITQFNVAAPFYTKYLSGETADARTALTEAQDAVMAEFQAQGGATPAS
jgi:ABC-type glycerol-3-phosphate transport system substrate-binding protein